jgi:hypothetical protein
MPRETPMFFLGAVFGIVGLLTACFNIWGPDSRNAHDDAANERSARRKFLAALLAQGFFVFLILLLSFVPMVRDPAFGHDPAERKQTTMLVVVCVLFSLACYPSFVAQGTLNEIAAHLPQRKGMPAPAQLAWVGGVSCALFMGVLREILRAALPDNIDLQGILFLGSSAFLSVLGITSLPTIQRQLQAGAPESGQGGDVRDIHRAATTAEDGGESAPLLAENTLDLQQAAAVSEGRPAVEDPQAPPEAALCHVPPRSLLQVVSDLRWYYVVMAADFFYMMALYPGVLSVIQGTARTSSAFTDHLFLAFNAGDFLGKVLPLFLPLDAERIRPRLVMLFLEVATLGPLVVLSALLPELHITPLAYVLAITMAAVHGYISVGTINAVSTLATSWHAVERRRAGELCFSMCFAGVGLGSILAIGLNYTPLVAQ